MIRLATRVALWFPFLIAAGAIASSAQTPPAAPCTVVTDPVVTIRVNTQAVVSQDCVEIRNGKTDVVWIADPEVLYLRIEFKPGNEKKLDNPLCAGSTCILEKAKHAAKKGEYRYNVEVELKSGARVKVDPNLIIKP